MSVRKSDVLDIAVLRRSKLGDRLAALSARHVALFAVACAERMSSQLSAKPARTRAPRQDLIRGPLDRMWLWLENEDAAMLDQLRIDLRVIKEFLPTDPQETALWDEEADALFTTEHALEVCLAGGVEAAVGAAATTLDRAYHNAARVLTKDWSKEMPDEKIMADLAFRTELDCQDEDLRAISVERGLTISVVKKVRRSAVSHRLQRVKDTESDA